MDNTKVSQLGGKLPKKGKRATQTKVKRWLLQLLISPMMIKHYWGCNARIAEKKKANNIKKVAQDSWCKSMIKSRLIAYIWVGKD